MDRKNHIPVHTLVESTPLCRMNNYKVRQSVEGMEQDEEQEHIGAQGYTAEEGTTESQLEDMAWEHNTSPCPQDNQGKIQPHHIAEQLGYKLGVADTSMPQWNFPILLRNLALRIPGHLREHT
jgi:hypothetical protein